MTLMTAKVPLVRTRPVSQIGALPRQQSNKARNTVLGKLVGTIRTTKYVKCATLQKKYGEHDVCASVAHVGT